MTQRVVRNILKSPKKWTIRELAEIAQSNSYSDTLNSDIADKMLQDVNIRLANQHDKICHMIKQITTKKSKEDDPKQKNGIIRAVNQSLHEPSLRQLMKQNELTNECSTKALKELNNLEVLHADTFFITDQLLSNAKPTISRFSKSDKTLLASVFEQIRSRHASTVETFADITVTMRLCEHFPHAPVLDHVLVDEFLRQRLGIQLLCDHYIALDKGKPSGGISLNCAFHDILTDAIQESKHICDANFGIAPNVYISHEDSSSRIKLHLIRPWVHHAIVELLKNAMTSSIHKDPFHPPDIYVEVDECHHNNILKCKIVDQGKGLKNVDEAFAFGFSSIQQKWDRLEEQQSYATVRPPIASLGVGLPISTMMMRMFGGNIHLERRTSGYQVSDHSLQSDHLDSGITTELHLPFSIDIEEWSSCIK